MADGSGDAGRSPPRSSRRDPRQPGIYGFLQQTISNMTSGDAALAAQLQHEELNASHRGGTGSARRRRPASLAELGFVASRKIADRKSVFQGFAVFSEHPKDVLDAVLVDPTLQTASHNMAAWRFLAPRTRTTPSGSNAQLAPDFVVRAAHDDDGESGGGAVVARVLERSGAVDVVCVVSRWYGGVMLGPVRFEHIRRCAQMAIDALYAAKDAKDRAQRVATTQRNTNTVPEDDVRETERLRKILVGKDHTIAHLRVQVRHMGERRDIVRDIIEECTAKFDEPTERGSSPIVGTPRKRKLPSEDDEGHDNPSKIPHTSRTPEPSATHDIVVIGDDDDNDDSNVNDSKGKSSNAQPTIVQEASPKGLRAIQHEEMTKLLPSPSMYEKLDKTRALRLIAARENTIKSLREQLGTMLSQQEPTSSPATVDKTSGDVVNVD